MSLYVSSELRIVLYYSAGRIDYILGLYVQFSNLPTMIKLVKVHGTMVAVDHHHVEKRKL